MAPKKGSAAAKAKAAATATAKRGRKSSSVAVDVDLDAPVVDEGQPKKKGKVLVRRHSEDAADRAVENKCQHLDSSVVRNARNAKGESLHTVVRRAISNLRSERKYLP